MREHESAGAGANVLVVDNNPIDLKLMADFLRHEGYVVRSARSGPQAAKMVEHDAPDLLLLDVSMPVMDGYEVCRRLKAAEATREIPIIFISALGDPEDKVRAFEAGGVDYVSKPFSFEEVAARVRTQVALGRSRRQLAESYRRLQELEELRDGVVHKIIHDMRSPLFTITASIELLGMRLAGKVDEKSLAILDSALAGGVRLRRMVDDVVEVSGMGAQKIAARSAEADLSRLVRQAARSVGEVDPDWRILVEAETPLAVRCDSDLVLRVIENLLVNGVTSSPPEAAVRIACGRSGAEARVEVADEGPALCTDSSGDPFDRFSGVRLGGARAGRPAAGGMAFCRLVIESHGGSIGAESGSTGNVVWFTLPRLASP